MDNQYLLKLIRTAVATSLKDSEISEEHIDHVSYVVLGVISPTITELKVRIRRAEKATYLAAKDEIDATYNVKTMDKRKYAEKIEAHMFDLFCRADKELMKETE